MIRLGLGDRYSASEYRFKNLILSKKGENYYVINLSNYLHRYRNYARAIFRILFDYAPRGIRLDPINRHLYRGAYFDRLRIFYFNNILKEEFYAYNHILDCVGNWCYLTCFVCDQKL